MRFYTKNPIIQENILETIQQQQSTTVDHLNLAGQKMISKDNIHVNDQQFEVSASQQNKKFVIFLLMVK